MKKNEQYYEWMERAEDDLKAVKSLLKDEIYSIAAFEAQQCVEKTLKAYLLEKENTIPKIHTLPELMRHCSKHNEEFMQFQSDLEWLNKFYQPARYPDAIAGMLPKGWPGKIEVEKALKIAEELFNFIELLLRDN